MEAEGWVIIFLPHGTTHAEVVSYVDDYLTTRGVEVILGSSIARLCDVAPTRNLLRRQHDHHAWRINGDRALNDLAPVALLVRDASAELDRLVRLLATAPNRIDFVAIEDSASELGADTMKMEQEIVRLEGKRYKFAADLRHSHAAEELRLFAADVQRAINQYKVPFLNFLLVPRWSHLRQALTVLKSRLNTLYERTKVELGKE